MTRLLVLALAALAGYALGRAVKREEIRDIKAAHGDKGGRFETFESESE